MGDYEKGDADELTDVWSRLNDEKQLLKKVNKKWETISERQNIKKTVMA